MNQELPKVQTKTDRPSSYEILFPKHQIQKEVYIGLSWLEENKVCSLDPIRKNSTTIFLFGHNHIDVFHFLYEVSVGDMMFLIHGKNQESYRVVEKKIISVSDKRYLERNKNKEIRMFTCTNDSETRLFVRAIKTI